MKPHTLAALPSAHPDHPSTDGKTTAIFQAHDALPAESQPLKDPVCGMTVTDQSPHKLAHERRSYYFCS
ncbi:hypothetical protein, partial [Polaromonas sp.]|uniref:hypothetical protein n=1 Tax=Polaromonas sp. TaxID=1869339 RepID=UPI00179ECBAC